MSYHLGQTLHDKERNDPVVYLGIDGTGNIWLWNRQDDNPELIPAPNGWSRVEPYRNPENHTDIFPGLWASEAGTLGYFIGCFSVKAGTKEWKKYRDMALRSIQDAQDRLDRGEIVHM